MKHSANKTHKTQPKARQPERSQHSTESSAFNTAAYASAYAPDGAAMWGQSESFETSAYPQETVIHTQAAPHSLKPQDILQMQRSIGNQATLRLMQRRQTENSPHAPAQHANQDSQECVDCGESIQRDALLQREVDPETLAWANTANPIVERIQDAVSAAVGRLNRDATTAIGHIRDSQRQYDRFSELYDAAVRRFTSGVEAAQAQEQQMRENLKFVAMLAFAEFAPVAHAVTEAIEGAVSKAESVGKILNATRARTTPADTSGGSSPAMAARSENRVDWSNLLTTTLTAFETTVQNNSHLQSTADECIAIVRFLDSVQEDRYSGTNPRSDPLAEKVDRMVTNVDSMIADLNAITEGIVSGPTGTLKDRITERVGGVSSHKLEQDLAIRWIAGLSASDRDQIDTADAYLAQIGVFDRGDNRLGYDTGSITTDIDERIIHWRAQTENTAMGLVGSNVTWLGNPLVPNRVIDDGTRCIEPRAYSGMMRDGRNREWHVNVPRGASPEGGGTLLLTGYTVEHMDSSGWEWSYPGDLQRQLRWEITFTGQPVGSTGGGAPAPQDVIHAPD